ncbi:MAG: Crp/Fnr family transcriptional regulator [Actinomycetota bacterium]
MTAAGRSRGLETSLQSTPPLDTLPTLAVKELVEKGRVHDYRKGTYLFHQGDDAPDVHFLTEGRVEITSTSVTGARQLHTTLEPPQLFGELGALGQMRRTASAAAMEPTTTLAIPSEDFLEVLASHPEASRAVFRALARQISEHEVLIEDLLYLDLKGRVAKRLIGLCTPSFDDLPEDGTVLPAVVTHADLASLSGGSRENVTRILSDFQRRGLVRRNGRRLVLAKVDGLSRLAGL